MITNNQKTKKAYGFFVTLLVVALTLVTAFVYMQSYQKLEVYMSWPAVYAMAIGAGVALILSLIGLDDFGTGLLAAVNLIGLLLFAKVIYGYVVVVLVGIDMNTFDTKFIVCTALFAVSFIASLVNFFLPQKKVVEA